MRKWDAFAQWFHEEVEREGIAREVMLRTTDPDTTTALRAILAVAMRGAAFDADDVHLELKARGQVIHPNAIGNAFRIAHAEKLVEEIGYKRSTRMSARGRRVLIYRWQGAAGR